MLDECVYSIFTMQFYLFIYLMFIKDQMKYFDLQKLRTYVLFKTIVSFHYRTQQCNVFIDSDKKQIAITDKKTIIEKRQVVERNV